MKQKLFSLGGLFVIRNEQGQEVFIASAIVIDIVRADGRRKSSPGAS